MDRLGIDVRLNTEVAADALLLGQAVIALTPGFCEGVSGYTATCRGRSPVEASPLA